MGEDKNTSVAIVKTIKQIAEERNQAKLTEYKVRETAKYLQLIENIKEDAERDVKDYEKAIEEVEAIKVLPRYTELAPYMSEQWNCPSSGIPKLNVTCRTTAGSGLCSA